MIVLTFSCVPSPSHISPSFLVVGTLPLWYPGWDQLGTDNDVSMNDNSSLMFSRKNALHMEMTRKPHPHLHYLNTKWCIPPLPACEPTPRKFDKLWFYTKEYKITITVYNCAFSSKVQVFDTHDWLIYTTFLYPTTHTVLWILNCLIWWYMQERDVISVFFWNMTNQDQETAKLNTWS